jgi:hypothetical protein
MAVNKTLSLRIYALAAVITLVVFTLGTIVGYVISNEKYNTITTDMESFQLQQKDIETEFQLANTLGSNSCGTLKYEIEKMANQSDSLGQRLSYYNNEILRNPEFVSLKKNYMINLVQFWSYWEQYKKNCNSTVNTVLYFYSINNCASCQAQGYVLSFLKTRYPNDIMVFSLDKDEDLYTINLLKSVYNVTSSPTMVINNKIYEGLFDTNQLKELMVI